ncbi:MAG: UbiA-like polyprenyltransferase [Chloroflexota bacterium]|jgi:4-hydroxybenzoate polyprenyltransferase
MGKLRTFLEMIRFEHTVFALPFAYLGMVLAWGSWDKANWSDFIWITVAMAAARTSAMALNRYVDRFIDAQNPRTSTRPIQTGKIDPPIVLALAILSLIVMAMAAWMLDPLAFFLSPVALLFLVGYSYTKRFTWLCHYILGFTDGLAPMGAWIGVRGSIFTMEDLPAWILSGIVTFWIGGFDIIYACLDVEFDLKEGIFSIPARFGIKRGLQVAAASHVITILLLALLGLMTGLGWPYWVGVILAAGLLAYEHSLVRPDDLSKLNIAFFNVNGYLSVTVLVATFLAILVG